MKEIILVKIGEIVLKGLNRRNFEIQLIKNIKKKISKLGSFSLSISQSTITIMPENDNIDLDEATESLSTIFGIANYSKAAICKKELDDIKNTTHQYLKDTLSTVKTFKVETKRADKKFALKSPEISKEVGSYISEKFPNLSVNVNNPDIVVNIEIRDNHAFVRGNSTSGAGGVPIGMGIKAVSLISGGIDSPVASYMMAKRGVELIAVHFASPPYTSIRAKEKVERLVKKVSQYSGKVTLVIVPFTNIQEQIRENCREEYFTIIMRRFMMKISESIAQRYGGLALITGESLGQVASQTLEAIFCTNAGINLPIFRPLIGMDKEEIISIARKIDTFKISIEPYEDCCTIFTPKHPKTKPHLEDILAEEQKLEADALIGSALDNLEEIIVD
ncbi:MAG: tRNA 4-thiouridine(8) synthase ThiI [Clostridia bacterium]|nr:tRNA 4-thiouridine(8) synthase ThiI [Clostridia bacterium]